ncbi:AraC family transcriptional regulator [Azospirillum sp. B510]|uniref:AraC family transcriptional regulator n=1 Tax=Azospirillum sp. (strain B510) TaxID=137722 RepID=UPI0013050E85|nr:AraC family transcriptional regulator [Azospirillum sp. B510]
MDLIENALSLNNTIECANRYPKGSSVQFLQSRVEGLGMVMAPDEDGPPLPDPPAQDGPLHESLEFPTPPAGSPLSGRRTVFPPRMLSDPTVLRALRFIENNRTGPLTVTAIAEQAGVSLHHFQRRFAAVMGETIGNHIRRLRLEGAATRLMFSPETILSIAVSSGYGSAEAFAHAFQRQFQVSPTDYRAQARAAIPPVGQEDHERALAVSTGWRESTDLLVVRFYGSHAGVADYWRLFAQQLAAAGLDPHAQRAVGMSLDNPKITERGFIRYDCAIEAPRVLPAPLKQAPFWRMTLAPTRVARLRHEESYDSVFSAYRALTGAWLPSRQEQFGEGPALERYDFPPYTMPSGRPVPITIELTIV